MGYLKVQDLGNGTSITYWRIYSIDLLRDDTKTIQVNLAGYLDQATREQYPNGILDFQQVVLDASNYPDITTELSNLYAKIYDTINSIPVNPNPDAPANTNTYFADATPDNTIDPVTTNTQPTTATTTTPTA